MQRDPHLPSPEVCDWLCSLEWSEVVPSAVITYPEGGLFGKSGSARMFSVFASAALGTDHIIEVELPEEGLAMLRADAETRSAADEANDRRYRERNTAFAEAYLQTQYPRLGGAA